LEKADVRKEVEIRKRPLMRKLARFVDTIWSKYKYKQEFSEREIKNELRKFGIVDDLSKKMALNFLTQTGILKSIYYFCEDELGFKITNERLFRMNTYARAIRQLQNEYVRTLTPKRYTEKPLESYFG
jgi:hypothetical protein